MKILSTAINNPGFIELQKNSILKYVNSVVGAENTELIIFNDAKDWDDYTNFFNAHDINKNMVNKVCANRCYLKCIDVPNTFHRSIIDLKYRYVDTLNFMMTYMLNNPDKYLVIDSDMFFVDKLNFSQLDSCYFAYVEQSTDGLPSPNMFYIDTINLNNKESIKWDINQSDLDWLNLLKNNNEPDKIIKFNYLPSLLWTEKDIPSNIHYNIRAFLYNDRRNANGMFFSEIYNNNILHIKGGSNWLHNELNYLLNPYDPSDNMLKIYVTLTNIFRQTLNIL